MFSTSCKSRKQKIQLYEGVIKEIFMCDFIHLEIDLLLNKWTCMCTNFRFYVHVKSFMSSVDYNFW